MSESIACPTCGATRETATRERCVANGSKCFEGERFVRGVWVSAETAMRDLSSWTPYAQE